jgi:hypothetical protein
MKRLLLLIGLVLVLLSCNSEDTNLPTYNYEIKKILGRKVSLKAGNTLNDLIFNKACSYVIDTVEISLNGPASTLDFTVQCVTYETMIAKAVNVTPHVNYIKFIDLKTNWQDNKSKKMYLKDKNDMPPKFFTYSGCNINLNNYPQFFVNNRYIPTYASLGVKPIFKNDIEIFKSNNVYKIGAILILDGVQYKVISKK